MKNTVKTSRVAGQLEKMFRALNTRFFGGELEEVIITLKKTPGAYGHITCGKTWNAGGKERHEINISTATLDRPIEETTATLLHEMCHLYNLMHDVQDCSRGNTYHNKKFKECAESHGGAAGVLQPRRKERQDGIHCKGNKRAEHTRPRQETAQKPDIYAACTG